MTFSIENKPCKSLNNYYSIHQRNNIAFRAVKPQEKDSFTNTEKKESKKWIFIKNALFGALGGLLGLGILFIKDCKKHGKQESIKFLKTLIKNKLFIGISAALLAGTGFWGLFLEKCKEKGKIKLQNYFKELTEAKGINSELIINDENFKNVKNEAQANWVNGKVSIKPKYAVLLNSYFGKKLLKHEIKHLEQAVIAGMYDLEQFNSILVKRWVNGQPEQYKKGIIYLNIKENLGGGSDPANNEFIDLQGYKVNFGEFSKAAYKILKNPNISKEQIPILINKDFYEKAAQAHGHLTEKEKIKAQKYFEALEKYPDMTTYSYFDFLNPFSNKREKYKDNILEKEAFEAQKTKD